ncbi:ThiF family adenylyltransferase [Photobacterium galatheae]|uniref:Thiamine biosynthesis protein ThiF n=1 Tax=Photobacterium galatheae TaxID=1654360 RepID=A0A066RMT0_9GAMM|nr:ThiF family adenylyltransferase [Photobacterium galatheae]KDM91730.1 thiamine biosynthesis protein ThiF [Photobacterium galatheae]MCM0149840.1 ThiF family adenylyltransferase [Photobacterium galatheae]
MPNNHSALVEKLGEFLSDRYSVKRLSEGEMQGLRITSSPYLAYWRIETDIRHPENGKAIQLIVAAKPTFPFSIPNIYTHPKLEVLKYPHVEEQGKLCVWGDDVSFDPQDITYIEHLIRDSCLLVEETISGKLDDDFSNGMLSYWERSYTTYPREKKATSLCNVKNRTSRQIHVAYDSTKGVIFADTEDELKRWLTNIGLKPSRKLCSTTFLLNLPDAWKPSEYPTKIGDILSILKTQGADHVQAIAAISYIMGSNLRDPAFLVQTNTPNGAIITAMRCVSGISTRGNAGQHNLPSVKAGNGFRDGRIFFRNLEARCAQIGIRGMGVERRDPSWVLGRDSNPSLPATSGTTIGIIGLGSVGSSLLPLLIKAGFCKFVLCDGEPLEAANVGRHLLGMDYVGINKALACENHIQRNYPWVDVLYAGSHEWFVDEKAVEELTTKCDLVISATAEWASDKAIQEIIENNSLTSSVVFCFTEAHAVATHCYVNKAGSFSYGSLFDNTGGLLDSCAKFDHQTIKETHFCGGIFQPYGGVELSFGHSMIVETVTELACEGIQDDSYRVWVGSRKLLQSVDGQWNQGWEQKHGEIGDGSKILKVV